jgi:hypothetical protein
MPLEQLIRDELSAATEIVPGGPDLTASLRKGRRRRRARTIGAVAGTTAAVAGLAIAATALVPDSGGPTASEADDVSIGRLIYPDYVSGTDIDKTMQETVSAYVPWIGPATAVYPSDWTSDDALPDADFANATEWEALYDFGAHESLVLVMSYNPPDEPTQPGCHNVGAPSAPGAPGCHSNAIGGGVVTNSGYRISEANAEGSDTYTYTTSFQIDGGFTVTALDQVRAGSWLAANAMRVLDETTLTQLVTDSSLTFPAPAAWPN